ncbi:MAG: glycosyltransferase [Bacillales bacterium]|jgi:glycosyltransferase involved in cell wall biosynthesis|nr:glycosyltransferase [Bacillales bacterium]
MEERESKKHILVLSQYFYPEQFRINDMCIEWVKRGYRVTVLTGIPNYPYGKFFKGYGFFKKTKESWNGMEIIRIPLIPRGKTPIGLILNYLSFVFSGYIWKMFTKVKTDLVFMYEVSPMTQTLIGVWYAKKLKIPCYLYVQDLWPENVEIVTGVHNKTILNNIGKMVDYVYKNCQKIFTTSESFVKEITKRGVESSKVSYWPQYAEEFYTPIKAKNENKIIDNGKFKIIFTGNIGLAQGLEILPKVAQILKENQVNVCFYIVGDGRNKLNLVKSINACQVNEMFIMIDRQPAEKIPELLSACDAGFISFMDNPLFSMTIPAKLQSYMACGIPVIASASGETAEIIKKADCGLVCEIGNASALANIIQEMSKKDEDELSSMGENAYEYCNKHFDKTLLMDKMENYFNESIFK